MKRPAISTAALLGALVHTLGSPIHEARGDAEQEEQAQALREKYPPINLSRFQNAESAAADLTGEELAKSLEVTGRMLDHAHKKWVAVQFRRSRNGLIENSVVF